MKKFNGYRKLRLPLYKAKMSCYMITQSAYLFFTSSSHGTPRPVTFQTKFLDTISVATSKISLVNNKYTTPGTWEKGRDGKEVRRRFRVVVGESEDSYWADCWYYSVLTSDFYAFGLIHKLSLSTRVLQKSLQHLL